MAGNVDEILLWKWRNTAEELSDFWRKLGPRPTRRSGLACSIWQHDGWRSLNMLKRLTAPNWFGTSSSRPRKVRLRKVDRAGTPTLPDAFGGQLPSSEFGECHDGHALPRNAGAEASLSQL